MLRKMVAVLFAATAAVPMTAAAQDAGAERRELERGDDRPVVERRAEMREAAAERRAESRPAFRPEPSFRPERQPDQPRTGQFRPEQPRVEQPRAEQPRPEQPRVAAEPQARSGWQGGRGDGPDRGDWRQRRPEAAAQPSQPRRAWSDDQATRDARRGDRSPIFNTLPQPDWRRPDDARRPSADQRRADAARRWQNNGRADDRRWSDRRDDDRFRNADRRWNNGSDRDWAWNGNRTDWRGADWNRRWRSDNRYDWGRYRQQNRSVFRLPRYYAPYQWNYGYRRFSIGVSLSSLLWAEDYWISDPWYYRLPETYGPYRWVRYYNDALLVDLRSGEVVDAVYDIFW